MSYPLSLLGLATLDNRAFALVDAFTRLVKADATVALRAVIEEDLRLLWGNWLLAHRAVLPASHPNGERRGRLQLQRQRTLEELLANGVRRVGRAHPPTALTVFDSRGC
jgi:hypothetical protein